MSFFPQQEQFPGGFMPPGEPEFDNYDDNTEQNDFAVGEEAGDETPADGGDFYENLAENLDDSELNLLATELIEEIKDDISSRSDWESSCSTILKYLGWKLEEYKKNLCNAIDNTLSTTLMNFLALAKSELFPESGPAKGMVEGYPTEDLIERAERVALFMNYFLTIVDKSYYPDKERLLLYVGLFGSAFTKVVMDPVAKRPSLRLVKPQNLIINNACTSLLESDRITEVQELSKKYIMIMERDGIFKKGTIKNYEDDDEESMSSVNKTIRQMEGVNDSDIDSKSENKSLFKFYECHVDLDPERVRDEINFLKDDEDDEEDNIPRPYIVKMCVSTNKIASINRNWKPQDNNFKRSECFVHYYYLPGFGIYSIGLGHLQGSNAIVLTNILRQCLDAESFKIFPAGFIQKGAYPETNNITLLPGEFKELQTNEQPMANVFSTLPYNGASPIMVQLRSELKSDTSTLGGASQQVAPIGASDAPVGTTLAQIEIRDRIPGKVLKSIRNSLSYELQLARDLFGEYLEKEPYPFNVPGNRMQVMKEDFSDTISVVPVSDPNLITNSQRIIINEILIRIAKENPGLFDVREAYRRFLKSMKVEDVDTIMPKPQDIMPADPITENMALLTGKGAKAGIQQDHASHIIVHTPIMQTLSQDQTKQTELAAAKAHIAEHQAMEYLIQIQQAMGQQMPNPQALQDPQVQNQIAMMAAQAVKQLQQQQQAQNPPPPNPTEVMMKDIQQREEAARLKHEEAQQKVELEAFKAQTQFESSKAKMDVEKELARDKNEVNLAIAKMKQPKNSE